MALETGTTDVRVPFVDLHLAHAGLKEPILAEIAEMIDGGAFVNGPAVARFEERFADYCGRRWCVGMGSGLDALRLALLVAGVGADDEVIIPADTFIATAEAVSQAGATPVPVDVSESDLNLDVAAVESALNARTRALLPVHLYGQLSDMAALLDVADRHGLPVIEDAAQAHGAQRGPHRAGSAGMLAAFSFYPAKNLGAFGDAGACVTDDPMLAEELRARREHGQRRKYEHEWEGYTARLDTIQAIALLHKLPRLGQWNRERRAAARLYAEALQGVGDLKLPPVAPGSDPVWHLYVVRTQDPEALGRFLRERGIASGRHYPQPIHLSPAYSHLGHAPGAFPVTERLAQEALSLPIFPGISEEQVAAVVGAVEDYFRAG
jgi:dTDP-4-amino-4,6-dideoxygalactose transaminase